MAAPRKAPWSSVSPAWASTPSRVPTRSASSRVPSRSAPSRSPSSFVKLGVDEVRRAEAAGSGACLDCKPEAVLGIPGLIAALEAHPAHGGRRGREARGLLPRMAGLVDKQRYDSGIFLLSILATTKVSESRVSLMYVPPPPPQFLQRKQFHSIFLILRNIT
ncbi:uncharacterized protein [Triticum aestivum]|uniref:uncharacterized protein n=1 Tax=Triticum aestivum TaxID=4565 RepID=UPI001D0272D6|nr:uncharacterized protein LOC123114998 [Triticum aestivum]